MEYEETKDVVIVFFFFFFEKLYSTVEGLASMWRLVIGP